MRQPKRKSRKGLVITVAVVLTVGIILYALADRYLIRHVEISDVNSYNAAQATDSSGLQTAANVQVTTEPVVVQNDDWNYVTDGYSISVEEVTQGSGSNKVTYFVADVQLSDSSQLRAALADNQFGRNITEDTSVIAEANDAVFAINGDYYGFRTDGIVIRNGILYRDEPARTGLAIYKDGTMKVYDETATTGAELLAEGVWQTLSFGPALLEDGAVPAGIESVEVDTNFGNHSIQGSQPRTGIGIIDENHFVFIVVDGRSSGYSKGVTMTEFAELFQSLGCTTAYNLDGGGSSTMYFQGRVVNNPLGRNQERGVSDILYIG